MKKRKQSFYQNRKNILNNLIMLFALILIFQLGLSSTAWAQQRADAFRRIRVIWTDELGIPTPAGLAFSFAGNIFYIVEAIESGGSPQVSNNINLMNLIGRLVGSVRIAAGVTNPLNMAFDSKNKRLLILEFPSKKIIEITAGVDGNLDSGIFAQFDAAYFGLQDPQGMTVDPASGRLLILDRAGPRIVRIDPDPENSFEAGVVSTVVLNRIDPVGLSGLALDPTSGNLHLMNTWEGDLYELTQAGQVVETRDLSDFDFSNLQGMICAPSGDLTDDPLRMSLYIADRGPSALEGQKTSSLRGGRIIELLLIRTLAP